MTKLEAYENALDDLEIAADDLDDVSEAYATLEEDEKSSKYGNMADTLREAINNIKDFVSEEFVSEEYENENENMFEEKEG